MNELNFNDEPAIYRFSKDFYYGELYGTFTALPSEIQTLIGKRLYFGEVLGKHSDVQMEIQEEDIELITNDQSVVAVFESNNLGCGYNPLEYYESEEYVEE